MKFVSELPGMFREGVLEASTPGRRVRRWAALGVLWGLGVTCLVLAGFAVADGSILPGITLGLEAVVFGLVSITVIITSSTSELTSK